MQIYRYIYLDYIDLEQRNDTDIICEYYSNDYALDQKLELVNRESVKA